ncbi:hypothetical protein, partial [Vallitalea maricola]|uniref:hypothetical protein n=1 Tax=Vallitalea maricola TaxID=3074433 RepID=UPI0030DDC5FC
TDIYICCYIYSLTSTMDVILIINVGNSIGFDVFCSIVMENFKMNREIYYECLFNIHAKGDYET